MSLQQSSSLTKGDIMRSEVVKMYDVRLYLTKEENEQLKKYLKGFNDFFKNDNYKPLDMEQLLGGILLEAVNNKIELSKEGD